jgi:hypothetical protein
MPGLPAPSQRKKSKALVSAVVASVVLLAAGAGFFLRSKTQVAESAPSTGSTAIASLAAPAKGSTVPAPSAAAEDEGLPRTLTELNAWYVEPPEGRNAAKYFQTAFDGLQITQKDKDSAVLPVIGKAKLPALEIPLPGPVKSAAGGFLKRNQAAWDALGKAAKVEQCRYPLDLTQSWKLPLPHLAKIKQCSQLGELFALQHADSGDREGATEGVLTALSAARSLEQEPLMIDQLVRAAGAAIAAESLEQTLNRVSLSPASLESLRLAFKHSEEFDAEGVGFMRALVGERAFGLAGFDLPAETVVEDMGKAGMIPGGAEQLAAHLRDAKTMKSERVFFLETYQELLAGHKRSYPDRLKAAENLPTRVDEAKKRNFILVGLLTPAVSGSFLKEAAALARSRLAGTAIALESFRATHGNKYPSKLGELSPKFLADAPLDPFDGQPLRYRTDGDGYELRSVGPEGGKPILFKVVKPPRPI